nr:hypothetical protein CFP56_32072 [Quercus suber]
MSLYLSTMYEKLTLPLNHVMNFMYFQLWPYQRSVLDEVHVIENLFKVLERKMHSSLTHGSSQFSSVVMIGFCRSRI